MVRIDPNKPVDTKLPPPGLYRAEVMSAKESLSKSGPMFSLVFKDVATGEQLCRDNIMLQGAGWSFSKEKLFALGVLKGNEPVDVHELDFIGRVVYLAVMHKPGSYLAKDGSVRTVVRAEVDIAATNPWCGYWHEDQKPDGYTPPPPPDEAPW